MPHGPVGLVRVGTAAKICVPKARRRRASWVPSLPNPVMTMVFPCASCGKTSGCSGGCRICFSRSKEDRLQVMETRGRAVRA